MRYNSATGRKASISSSGHVLSWYHHKRKAQRNSTYAQLMFKPCVLLSTHNRGLGFGINLRGGLE